MMSGRNGSVAGGTNGNGRSATAQMPTSIRPKKKPAPPRPPQPSINRLQTSVSFNSAHDLASNNFGRPKPTGKDLIDFKTPPGSPNSGRRNTVSQISTALKDPNNFSYRVGASIFYIKSPLKNSASETPIQNPFSPPRPSVEAQKPIAAGANLQSSINAAWNSAKPSSQAAAWDTQPKAGGSSLATSNTFQNVSATRTTTTTNSHFNQIRSSLENNNTMKSNHQPAASPWLPAGASSSSNASSDRTSNSFSDFGSSTQQPRYSNVPVAEPAKKELTSTLSSGSGAGKPTIIRPLNKTLSQMSDRPSSNAQTAHNAVISSIKKLNSTSEPEKVKPVATAMQRNYYDLPPEEEEEDGEDEFNDSSFISPPMPTEPPPPPPADVSVDDWVSSTVSVKDYPDNFSDAGHTTAYAIALYDFYPEAEGDLQLQAGDLVYLLRKIDDSWYHGSRDGMEGLLPSNFVNVVVPLPDDSSATSEIKAAEYDGIYVDVLYDFAAETEGDLSLQAGEKIRVTGRINEDWLYGEKQGTKGQFPSAFVDEILQDLPIVKT